MAGFTLGAIAGSHGWGAIAGVPLLGCRCWVPLLGVPWLGAIARVPLLGAVAGCAMAGCYCWGAVAGCHCWGAVAGCHCGLPLLWCHCEKKLARVLHRSPLHLSLQCYLGSMLFFPWRILTQGIKSENDNWGVPGVQFLLQQNIAFWFIYHSQKVTRWVFPKIMVPPNHPF